MKQRILQFLPFALLGMLFVGVFIPLPPHESSRIRDYLQDLGHFPACVIAFWALYNIRWINLRWWHRALEVALIVTVVQTAIELLQPLVGRSASFRDWSLGFAGTLFAMGFTLLFHVRKSHHKSLLILKMVALVLFSLLPLGLLIKEHRDHIRAFPLLASFESRREIARWDLYGLKGELSDEYVAAGEKSARFTVNKEFSFPGLFMEGFITDWTGYHAVTCDLYLEGDQARTLAMRVDDHQDVLPYAERGQAGVPLVPGFNSIALPVDELMITPSGRAMDRTHITRFGLFFEEKHVGDVFYVDNFKLVK